MRQHLGGFGWAVRSPTGRGRTYDSPGGRPFLFYVVYGVFSKIPTVDSQEYRTLGVPPGLTLSRYGREKYPDVLAGFEEGYIWDELSTQDPDLARLVSASSECLILRGELDDRGNLNYLRDSVGLLTWLLDHGGVCVYDPQMFRWWGPGTWRRQVFDIAGPVPREHVVILTSDEDEARTPDVSPTWFHTRGLRKSHCAQHFHLGTKWDFPSFWNNWLSINKLTASVTCFG